MSLDGALDLDCCWASVRLPSLGRLGPPAVMLVATEGARGGGGEGEGEGERREGEGRGGSGTIEAPAEACTSALRSLRALVKLSSFSATSLVILSYLANSRGALLVGYV